MKVLQRRIVRTEDVMAFEGIGRRMAQTYMAEVREHFNKGKRDKITVRQYCQYYKYPEDEFLLSMR